MHKSSRGSEKERKNTCHILLKHCWEGVGGAALGGRSHTENNSNENDLQFKNVHVTFKSTENAKDFLPYLEQTKVNSHKVRHRGAVDRKSETCEIKRLHQVRKHSWRILQR